MSRHRETCAACGYEIFDGEEETTHKRCGWCGECPSIHADAICAADFNKALHELTAKIHEGLADERAMRTPS